MFVPKLFSTLLGALWLIGLFSSIGPVWFYALAAPFILVLGIFVSVMLAAMVKNDTSSLRQGFMDALNRWREVFFSSLAFILIGFITYIPAAAGFGLSYITGNVFFVIVGGLASLAFLISVVFLAYFFPISLLEKESVISGLKDSASTSIRNSREVTLLTFFSVALLALASLAGETGLKLSGYLGFFLLRIVSGVVTTYIFVVSPEYYLEN